MTSVCVPATRVRSRTGSATQRTRHATLDYRPHLDGIRALAVALVIAFHLGVRWTPAGFIGVDVFFVLSGYLITSLLVAELADGARVRLARFYARRARRLLPASVVVLVACAVASAAWLDAVQQHVVAADVTASSLFSANWWFTSSRIDYFAPGDVASPLRHYWSLAVEEQFYVVWPALVWAAWRITGRRRPTADSTRLLWVLLPVGVASAALATFLDPSPVTYFGTHTRAYQLVAGATLAIAFADGRRERLAARVGARAPQAVALAAVVLVVWLAHVLGGGDYPGPAALAVTAASTALLGAVELARGGLARRVLGCGPAAAIGRLSYSLYLWHWPVIVFAPVLARRWEQPLLTNRVLQLACTCALAALSYAVVERPIRFRLRPRARARFVLAPALAAVVIVAAVAGVWGRPRGALAAEAFAAVRDLARPGDCPYFKDDWPDPDDSVPCLYRPGGDYVVAFVGDSHAQQWQPALEEIAARRGWTVVRATRGGCPANDVTPYHLDDDGLTAPDDECREWRHVVYRRLIDSYDPDLVLVATRSHVLGVRHDGRDVAPKDAAHVRLWSESWDWTMRTLTSGGAAVVVSEILPTLPERVPACLASHGATGRCDFRVAGDRRVPPYNDVVATLSRRFAGVEVIDPVVLVCPEGLCRARDAGVIVHRDDNHISATFARSLANEVERLLARAVSSSR